MNNTAPKFPYLKYTLMLCFQLNVPLEPTMRMLPQNVSPAPLDSIRTRWVRWHANLALSLQTDRARLSLQELDPWTSAKVK